MYARIALMEGQTDLFIKNSDLDTNKSVMEFINSERIIGTRL